jgi:hypothetical protein
MMDKEVMYVGRRKLDAFNYEGETKVLLEIFNLVVNGELG